MADAAEQAEAAPSVEAKGAKGKSKAGHKGKDQTAQPGAKGHQARANSLQRPSPYPRALPQTTIGLRSPVKSRVRRGSSPQTGLRLSLTSPMLLARLTKPPGPLRQLFSVIRDRLISLLLF